jgi:hypothetical protein
MCEDRFAGAIWKILDRVTIDRALSGSVTLAESSMIEFRSSSERRALSVANAGPILGMFGTCKTEDNVCLRIKQCEMIWRRCVKGAACHPHGGL